LSFPTDDQRLKNCANSPLYKVETGTHSPAPMTFAVIDWLSISINLLLVIFVVVCLLMTLLILMQRPKQEGLGAAFGGGVTDQVFGARTTNVLQRGTVYLASLFFILALALAVLIGHQNKKTSMLTPETPVEVVEEAAPAAPQEEVQPKSLSEELPAEETAPPADAPENAPETNPSTPATPEPQAEPEPANTSAPAETAPAADSEEKSEQP
jgi:preprotein translocase subunit SecG